MCGGLAGSTNALARFAVAGPRTPENFTTSCPVSTLFPPRFALALPLLGHPLATTPQCSLVEIAGIRLNEASTLTNRLIIWPNLRFDSATFRSRRFSLSRKVLSASKAEFHQCGWSGSRNSAPTRKIRGFMSKLSRRGTVEEGRGNWGHWTIIPFSRPRSSAGREDFSHPTLHRKAPTEVQRVVFSIDSAAGKSGRAMPLHLGSLGEELATWLAPANGCRFDIQSRSEGVRAPRSWDHLARSRVHRARGHSGWAAIAGGRRSATGHRDPPWRLPYDALKGSVATSGCIA